MEVQNKNLKWAVIESPQSDVNFERYIIENQDDLDAFAKEFSEINLVGVRISMQDCINEGRVVLATDRHPISNFPTWCVESRDLSHSHSFKRV